jgi:predicted metal-dependent peptidase
MSIAQEKASRIKKTPFSRGGKSGIIVHDKLCADGPVDQNGNPLLDENGEEIPGKNDDMHSLLARYAESLIQPTNLYLGSNEVMTVPRYGVLSLLAQNTPIHVYDHPALKKITNTAFTDGIHVFIDADFMRELVKQEEESNTQQSGIVFLILHELMHKLYMHVDRLKQFPHDIANIAEDMVINGKIIKSFPTVQPVDLLTKIGFGMKASEADKYHQMAEEIVAEQLLLKRRKEESEEKKQKGGQGKSQGGAGKNQQGSGSGSGGGQGQGQGDEDGEEQNQNQENGQGGDEEKEYSPIHHITPEELIDILEQNGLEGTLEGLNMPTSADDVDAIAEKKERNQLNITDAVQNAMQQALQAGGKYPGQHIAEEAMEIIGSLKEGKISWKLAIRREVGGEGQKMRDSEDEAHIIWHFDKDLMGVDPWYMPAPIPHAPDETVLCLVDSSGSTGGGTMRQEFMQEVLNLKNGMSANSDYARKVILFSADTVLRGEPIEITASNFQKFLKNGLPLFGNGGTDFLSCLNQAVELPLMKKEKVKTVIYFTDCYDHTPSRKDFEKYLNKGMKFVFVTTPGTWNEQWNAGVADWAEVYCIEDGTVANLDKESIDKNTRKNRR